MAGSYARSLGSILSIFFGNSILSKLKLEPCSCSSVSGRLGPSKLKSLRKEKKKAKKALGINSSVRHAVRGAGRRVPGTRGHTHQCCQYTTPLSVLRCHADADAAQAAGCRSSTPERLTRQMKRFQSTSTTTRRVRATAAVVPGGAVGRGTSRSGPA